ncbi:MAG: YlmH/Sll1252 family protein [Phascolarctobacterium sp.]|nr:YlmH/Sll1252 family protein [Phascolarctobacterium sp.]
MADREKILRYFRSSGDEQTAAKLLDLAESANKSRKFKVSDFLDPHTRKIAEIVAANYDNIRIETDGGFLNAERVKAAFIAEDFQVKLDFGIACFAIVWNKRYYRLSHRDILGAFMGTGCKREALGDIVITNVGAQIVTDTAIAGYLVNNLLKIGAAPVTLKKIGQDDLLQKEEKVKIIKVTVAELRLDAVAAVGYGISRSRMNDAIKDLNVRINWQYVKKPVQHIQEGDIISFSGRGRVEVAEICGTTKKGRISIVLKRYV